MALYLSQNQQIFNHTPFPSAILILPNVQANYNMKMVLLFFKELKQANTKCRPSPYSTIVAGEFSPVNRYPKSAI
jgi:hypothetical protein